MVPRVASLSKRIGLGLALEIRARHVVQQQVVLQPEEFAEAILQEHFQGFFVRQQRVQGAVETLLIDLLDGNAQKIGQRAFGVEMLGDVQFAGGIAEATENEDQRHQRPGDVFLARGDGAVEEVLQAQLFDEFQPQPRAAEITTVLHAQAFDIDFHPLRPNVVEKPLLPWPRLAFGGVLHAQTMRLVELSQIGDDALAGPALAAIRLHQRPVGVPFAVFSAIARANEHARIVSLPMSVPKGKVFTTTPCGRNASRPRPQQQGLASRNPTSVRGSTMTRFPPNHPLLANLG